jgi:hypothetical protein
MGGSLVLVFNRLVVVIGQNADTQLLACAQLVLVEISESLRNYSR